MLDFLELEETVGKAWHRLVGQTRSMPRYPEQAVALDEMKPVLASCFRGFGGDHAIQLAAAHQRTSKHRLKLRQLIGLGEERIARSGRDFARAMLPDVIDLFPDRRLNRALSIWLTAAIATLPETQPAAADPLARDIERLHMAISHVDATLAAFPGLRSVYRDLCRATLAERTRGTLPSVERLLEGRIVSLLRAGAGLPDDTPSAIFPRHAPPGYQPMMDVPLWPEFLAQEESRSSAEDTETPLGDPQGSTGKRRFGAKREREDEKRSERSPFILNRFEKSWRWRKWSISTGRPTTSKRKTARRPRISTKWFSGTARNAPLPVSTSISTFRRKWSISRKSPPNLPIPNGIIGMPPI